MMVGEKRCSRCKNVLPLDAFGTLRRAPDGHSHRCQECERARQRQQWREQIQPLLADERRCISYAIGRIASLTPDERLQQRRPITQEQWQRLIASRRRLCCAACRGLLRAQTVDLGRIELVCWACARVILTVECDAERSARLMQQRAFGRDDGKPRRGRPPGGRGRGAVAAAG